MGALSIWHLIIMLVILGSPIAVIVLLVQRSRRAQTANFANVAPGGAGGPVLQVEPTAADGSAPKMTSTKYCSGCGSLIHLSASQCPKCGAPQAGAGGTHSRVAAILFALLLGGLGIHKFYLGRVGWGVLYLLFCWTFIPAVIALIEGIIYLTMTDQAFAAKYG